MNHRFPASFKRLAQPCLALLAAAVLFAPSAANATPYVVKLMQQGSNVVATGSGEFDLTGLTYDFEGYAIAEIITPDVGALNIGSPGNADEYIGFAGPTSFGSGSGTQTTTGTGDTIVMAGSLSHGVPFLFVPRGYASGTSLTSGATWDNASFASLGVTSGTYRWTWGAAADQSFTLMIGGGTASVPEPEALGMFGLGLLWLGGFAALRRREPPQIG